MNGKLAKWCRKVETRFGAKRGAIANLFSNVSGKDVSLIKRHIRLRMEDRGLKTSDL